MKLASSAKTCLAFVLIAHSATAARLQVPPEGVSFDEIPAGESVTRTISIENVSSVPVAVSRVKACCGAEVELSPMVVPPSEKAGLSVTLHPMPPGKFEKSVQLLCDDPEKPLVEIPVSGTVLAGSSAKAVSSRAIPAIVLAGLADGFNPCAFSIVIVLAGILAVGGRNRRARLLGGCAFCFGSFAAYMAMGLGLMQVLKALEALRALHGAVMTALALALFALSALSFRDAFRYRKARVPSAITLQLPDRVKRMIKTIAEKSWSGSAVTAAGFGCGVLVTFLDSLCTGQVYVPVLALLSREPEAWRALAVLTLYNLAFIAPLVAVFVLAAKGADAAQMSRWSKRNVFPSKLALGLVFAILGALILVGLFPGR